MADITQQRARVIGTVSGNSPQILYFPEAGSQSYKAGEFVYLVEGKVTVCGDDGVVILGMAVADATGVTDTQRAVYIANNDTIFEANVYHSTPASAVTAITQVGTKYALQVDANKHYVDIEDTSHDALVVLRLSPKDKVGDKYGRVHFQVLPACQQLGSAGV